MGNDVYSGLCEDYRICFVMGDARLANGYMHHVFDVYCCGHVEEEMRLIFTLASIIMVGVAIGANRFEASSKEAAKKTNSVIVFADMPPSEVLVSCNMDGEWFISDSFLQAVKRGTMKEPVCEWRTEEGDRIITLFFRDESFTITREVEFGLCDDGVVRWRDAK